MFYRFSLRIIIILPKQWLHVRFLVTKSGPNWIFNSDDAVAGLVDPAAIKRHVVRKCDFRVVISTSVLFLFSFLDQINIGNARIQGLEKDLHTKGHDYNVALLVIFPAFILFEIPSNLILKRVAPSVWLSFLLFACGAPAYLILC